MTDNTLNMTKRDFNRLERIEELKLGAFPMFEINTQFVIKGFIQECIADGLDPIIECEKGIAKAIRNGLKMKEIANP